MKARDEERDRELDLAWHAANRDEPPAAVDIAIAAAARRTVGAGPASARASRAWWPVAAAAVVALVAVGIVEMTPREQMVPTMPSAQQAPAAEPATLRDAVKDEPAPTPAVPERAPARATEAKRKVEQAPSPLRAESPPPDAQDAVSGHAAGALAGRNQVAPPSAPAAVDQPAAQVRAKKSDAEPRTVEEWVRTIRRYKAEGRSDLAAKELALFRARYPDRADTLLPPDLREVKP